VGAYGRGELKYNQHITSPSSGKLSLNYDFGLYAKIIKLTLRKSLYEGGVTIYEWPQNSRATRAALMQYLQSDESEFELLPRVQSSSWYGDQVILQENVYVDAVPLIAEVNGKRVMVFLTDDPNRGD
jgi:hypothetical protein